MNEQSGHFLIFRIDLTGSDIRLSERSLEFTSSMFSMVMSFVFEIIIIMKILCQSVYQNLCQSKMWVIRYLIGVDMEAVTVTVNSTENSRVYEKRMTKIFVIIKSLLSSPQFLSSFFNQHIITFLPIIM